MIIKDPTHVSGLLIDHVTISKESVNVDSSVSNMCFSDHEKPFTSSKADVWYFFEIKKVLNSSYCQPSYINFMEI